MVTEKLDRNELIKSYGFVEQLSSNENFLQESLQLASKMLDCPVSYISLIDEEKQYILSQLGSTIKTIDATDSICQNTIDSEEVLVISNTLKDERSNQLPLVVDDKFVFYAGYPLTNSDGVNVGALCVLDYKQKEITSNQKDSLKILSKQVMSTLDNQRNLIKLIKRINSNFKPAACADLNCLNGELAHLSDEVVLQNQKIIDQKQELEKSNKKLQSFAHVVAHDVKAPLRSIGSFTQIIESDLKSNNVNYNNEYFGFIKKGVKNLSELTDNLLESAKLEGLQAKPESLVLNDLLNTVYINLSTLINEKSASLNFPIEDIKVFGDKIQLIQLFQNLISNGLKYQIEGNKPSIGVSAKQVNDKVGITVSDNGMGIAEHDLQLIFEPYKRLENSKDIEGFGIGLSTCKEIVERHNSSITVKSKLNEGTSISFELPIADT